MEEFFIICISGIAFLFPWVVFTKAKYLKTKNHLGYILRALFSITGMVTWIEALKSIGSNEATLISYLIPLFTLALAAVFKEEKINKIVFLSITLCIVIILFTLKLETLKFNLWGVSVALCSVVSWALYEIICKKQSYSEHYLSQAFYTFLFAGLMMLPYVIRNDILSKIIDHKEIGFLGALRVMNVVCLFLAYKFAPINVLAPLAFLRLVFMGIGSFILFQIIPSLSVVIASIIIVAINIYTFQIQKLRKNNANEIL
ncbi:hypothetical protein I862_02070 [endosymbiont of Acanthamoeba sp. UWC8]|nr:hypothetical protein I862_02070 [endosymbiont of Acanthamoeba sp. UWC8]